MNSEERLVFALCCLNILLGLHNLILTSWVPEYLYWTEFSYLIFEDFIYTAIFMLSVIGVISSVLISISVAFRVVKEKQ